MDPELFGEDAPRTSSSPALHFHRPCRSTSFILVLYQRPGVCSLSSGLSFLCENQALRLQTSLGCFCPLGGRDARRNEWALTAGGKCYPCPLSLHKGWWSPALSSYHKRDNLPSHSSSPTRLFPLIRMRLAVNFPFLPSKYWREPVCFGSPFQRDFNSPERERLRQSHGGQMCGRDTSHHDEWRSQDWGWVDPQNPSFNAVLSPARPHSSALHRVYTSVTRTEPSKREPWGTYQVQTTLRT